MSIHDETWDKCNKCGQTVKTWHGDYHISGGCLNHVNFHSWQTNSIVQSLPEIKKSFPELICVDIPAPDYTGKSLTIDYAKMGMKPEDFQYKFKPMNKKKNNITTGGYFLKRLRDSGFIAIRLFNDYPISDPRKWTMMVDPSGHCLMITCYINKENPGEIHFEFNDGGNRFKNYNLKTQSMEIIITTLIEKGVPQNSHDNSYSSKSGDDG